MTVLERSELEASPLADLHAIADQVGLEGFRRLRKADLIAAILDETGSTAAEQDDGAGEERDQAEGGQHTRTPRGTLAGRGQAGRRRPLRSRRSREDAAEGPGPSDEADSAEGAADFSDTRARTDLDTAGGARRGRRRGARAGSGAADAGAPTRGRADAEGEGAESAGRIAAGVVEVLGNGSAFLRVDPP